MESEPEPKSFFFGFVLFGGVDEHLLVVPFLFVF
jgi:hypothetical protein